MIKLIQLLKKFPFVVNGHIDKKRPTSITNSQSDNLLGFILIKYNKFLIIKYAININSENINKNPTIPVSAKSCI